MLSAPEHMTVLTPELIEGGAVKHEDQAVRALPGCWHYRYLPDGAAQDAEITVWPDLKRAAWASGSGGDSLWGDYKGGDQIALEDGSKRTLRGDLVDDDHNQ